jgi:hypothetical protein
LQVVVEAVVLLTVEEVLAVIVHHGTLKQVAVELLLKPHLLWEYQATL